jgi:hypothetical protein
MPADTDPGVLFSAKDLPDLVCGAAERFDFRNNLVQPCRDRFGPL